MDDETDRRTSLIAGATAANLVAIEALNNALTEAGIIPEGLLVQAIRAWKSTDRGGAFDEGVGIVTGVLESRGVPPGRPEWLRGVIDGGKSGLGRK